MSNEQSECKCGGMIFVNGHGKGVCRECGAETWPDERHPQSNAEWMGQRLVEAIVGGNVGVLNRARGGMKL